LKKTDQGQGMKLKDQIIDKNFENVNIPPKKANQPLKKDEQILVDLEKGEMKEASESTVSDFKELKEKQLSKREERQEKINIKTDEKVKWVRKAEEQEKIQKAQQEKQDLLTGFIVQSMNNSQMMMSQFMQREKKNQIPQSINQSSSTIDSQNFYQQSTLNQQSLGDPTLESSLQNMKNDLRKEIVAELKDFLAELLKK